MSNFTKMSRKQLEKTIKDAERALKALETKEKRAAKKAAEAAAAKFGFKLSDLTSIATKPTRQAHIHRTPRNRSVAKYANPTTQTWTGKGRQPNWFKMAMAQAKCRIGL